MTRNVLSMRHELFVAESLTTDEGTEYRLCSRPVVGGPQYLICTMLCPHLREGEMGPGEMQVTLPSEDPRGGMGERKWMECWKFLRSKEALDWASGRRWAFPYVALPRDLRAYIVPVIRRKTAALRQRIR